MGRIGIKPASNCFGKETGATDVVFRGGTPLKNAPSLRI